MKIIFTLCLCLVNPLFGWAQTTILPTNQLGKISIHEEILMDSVARATLFVQAQQYCLDLIPEINKKGKKSKKALRAAALNNGQDSLNTWISMVNYYILYEGLVKRRVYGEVSYITTIAVSGTGYAYNFSDFYFQAYERNRYGQFVKSRKKRQAIEKINRNGLQQKKRWQNHDKKIQEHINKQIAALKLAM